MSWDSIDGFKLIDEDSSTVCRDCGDDTVVRVFAGEVKMYPNDDSKTMLMYDYCEEDIPLHMHHGVGLTLEQTVKVLRALDNSHTTAADIADATEYNAGIAYSILDKLDDMGLVRRGSSQPNALHVENWAISPNVEFI